jgi:hypothetical protein
MTPAAILKRDYPPDIVDALLAAYTEIESNYALRKWKASELDAGHFVEAARRMLEHKLFGAATPIGTDLPKFNDVQLARYENVTGHDDAFRFLIPRALRSIYGVRNKRGVGHVGTVSPNEMDATLILYSAKWVLAEFTRQASGLSVADAQKAVDSIIERRLSVLWKHKGLTRVVHSGIDAREQVLVLLYDKNEQHEEDLRAAIEYKNKTNFRKILGRLHKKRLIELAVDGICTLTTPGIIEAEDVLRNLEADT